MKITIFPALNGDCILIEYDESHCMLIDGGYVDTYNLHLVPVLSDLASKGKVIDLLVVTHIDSDHISGIVKLLSDTPNLIPIKEIWYNGYRHIQCIVSVSNDEETIVHKEICRSTISDETKSISAKQGCTLSALIQRCGLFWNGQFNGNAVIAPATVNIGNASIHVLSPEEKGLSNLCAYWRKELIKKGLLPQKHSMEFWDDAFEFMMAKDKPAFHFHIKKIDTTTDIEKIKQVKYIPDLSATNGSSISFVLECEGKRLLLLGDAHAETIVTSLKYLNAKKQLPLSFDAIKLSHHGSFNNNSPELLRIIDSENWIVSTNGGTYNHPDLETLVHVFTIDKNKQRRIFFNYDLPVCNRINLPEYHDEYHFSVVSKKDGTPLTINL